MKININCSENINIEIYSLIEDSKKSFGQYSDHEKTRLLSRTNWVLESLFKNEYGSYCIPWDFIDSELGRHLIQMKYEFGGVSNLVIENSQQFFTTTEVSLIRGVSRQAIDQQIRNGKIKSISDGQPILLITKMDVISHLTTKFKISYSEGEKMVAFYEKLKENQLDPEFIKEKMIEYRIQLIGK